MSDELHPKGRFKATVTQHRLLPGTGKPGDDNFKATSLEVDFATTHGAIRTWLSFSAAAKKWTEEKIRAMGFVGTGLDLVEGASLVGNTCEVQVDHEHYEGKDRAKVGFINPVFRADETDRDAILACLGGGEGNDDDSNIPF